MHQLHIGDNLEVLPTIESDSVDMIFTDPPYAWNFMGNSLKWDKALPNPETWKQCLRVLKPGCFAFIMSGTRADCLWRILRDIEEAGFNIGFTINLWLYKSGFPKAMNISKKIDQKLGCEREITGVNQYDCEGRVKKSTFQQSETQRRYITSPSSPLAQKMEGSFGGYQPKPACECVIVAMKPLTESGYLAQAMKDGKGVSWLDDCRVPLVDYESHKTEGKCGMTKFYEGNGTLADKTCKDGEREIPRYNIQGRFPANILVSDEAIDAHKYFSLDRWFEGQCLDIPKASKREKNEGCEGIEKQDTVTKNYGFNDEEGIIARGRNPEKHEHKAFNSHPTCKPVKLPAYFITLGTRPGDVVLDPFTGSGTTGVAAVMLNRQFIGIEMNPEYAEITKARIEFHENKPEQIELLEEAAE